MAFGKAPSPLAQPPPALCVWLAVPPSPFLNLDGGQASSRVAHTPVAGVPGLALATKTLWSCCCCPGTHRWTDVFVGLSTCGRNMSAHRVLEALARALEGVPTGQAVTAELMAHPGYPIVPPLGGCGEGPDAFSCSLDRLHELRVLTAPALRAQLAQDGVQLCTLEDLDGKRPGEGAASRAAREPFVEPSPP